MAEWQIDSPVRRCGGYADDEQTDGYNAPDWEAVIKLPAIEGRRVYHMCLQFPRPGIDREEAEAMVQAVLDGLNAKAGG